MKAILTAVCLFLAFVGGIVFCLPLAEGEVINPELDVVAAHYVPWFKGDTESGNWDFTQGHRKITTAYRPLLGKYNSKSQKVLSQHIQWALGHGVNTFMIEWPGLSSGPFRNSYEDVVSTYLHNKDFHKIKFFFVYSLLSATQKEGEEEFRNIDLNDKDSRNKIINDFHFACSSYFNQRNYLHLKGRPVIYLWATGLAGDHLPQFISDLRKDIRRNFNYEFFLIGDQVGWNSRFNQTITPCFDAVMPYALVDLNSKEPEFQQWSQASSQLEYWKNSCSDANMHLVPSVFPGFDTSGASWCYDQNNRLNGPVIKRSAKLFRKNLETASRFIDPEIKMLLVTSWNEWNEGTNIEPSEEFGFSYLEVLKDFLQSTTITSYKPQRLEFTFSQTYDPPGPDDRQLACAFDYISLLNQAGNEICRYDIGSATARNNLGSGWFDDEYNDQMKINFAWAGGNKLRASLFLSDSADYSHLKIHYLPATNAPITLKISNSVTIRLPEAAPHQWTTSTIKVKCD